MFRLVVFGLAVSLIACRKTPDAPARVETDGAHPTVSAVLDAAPPPAASKPDAAAPLAPPASLPVKPKIEIAYDEGDGAPEPGSPRMMSGFRATGLPAISTDGRFVLVTAADETAKSCRGYGQLLVFELPKQPGKARLVSHQALFDECTWESELRGGKLVQTAFGKKTEALVRAANATIARYDLRTFDTGPAREVTDDAKIPLRFLAAELTLFTDENDGIQKAVATTSTGPLFAIDLSTLTILPDGKERSGMLTSGMFAIDTKARAFLVRGAYSSVNSWFSGDKTTTVFAF